MFLSLPRKLFLMVQSGSKNENSYLNVIIFGSKTLDTIILKYWKRGENLQAGFSSPNQCFDGLLFLLVGKISP